MYVAIVVWGRKSDDKREECHGNALLGFDLIVMLKKVMYADPAY